MVTSTMMVRKTEQTSILNRRKAIGKAIAKKRGKVKEGFSAWRIDLDFNEQVKSKRGLVSPSPRIA